jgi:anti-sigma-K factor RskA
MERQGIHELSAPYALDALSPEEQREFEEHLARCAECREAVAAFHDTAAALAHGIEALQPPPALRGRILEEARNERRNVVPLRPRWTYRITAAVAAVAAIAAVALGIWAASLNSRLGDRPEAIEFEGANGSLIVGANGEGTLVVQGLDPAPTGKTYEIWVIDGATPKPAGLFAGGEGRTAVALTRPVPAGATVAVTLERAGGVDAPTSMPLFQARNA